MGLSSSKSSTKPIYSQQIEGAANTLGSVYNANAPALQDIGSKIQGLVPGLIDKYNAGNPAVKAATGYTTDVLGGKFLDGNPHLDDIVNTTNNDVQDRINALFSRSGQTGSSRQIGELGRRLSEAENTLRYNDYGAERDRMAQAAGMAPGLAAADYAGITPVLAAAEGGTLPISAASQYGAGIGGLLGQYTQTKQSGGLGQLLLQAAAQAGSAAIMASDPRLKAGVSLIGRLPDGLGVYRYTYRAAPNAEIGRYMPAGEQIGVMADEVAALRPEALGPVIGGFATVNYGVL